MSEAKPEWTVLYHGGGKFKGRGEFLRLLLRDAGVNDYCEDGSNLVGPKGRMCAFRGSLKNVQDNEESIFPLMYPPAIHHVPKDGSEEVVINQVPACLIYMGEQLGYAPKDRAERARALCVLTNAVDYLAEGRMTFHPVENKRSYFDQKEEGDKVSKEFSTSRMQIWLGYFDKVVQGNASTKGPIAGGPKVSFADIALFHVLDATVAQFNTEFYEMAWDKCDVPSLKEYYGWMKSRPNIADYQRSERCPPWSGNSMM